MKNITKFDLFIFVLFGIILVAIPREYVVYFFALSALIMSFVIVHKAQRRSEKSLENFNDEASEKNNLPHVRLKT